MNLITRFCTGWFTDRAKYGQLDQWAVSAIVGKLPTNKTETSHLLGRWAAGPLGRQQTHPISLTLEANDCQLAQCAQRIRTGRSVQLARRGQSDRSVSPVSPVSHQLPCTDRGKAVPQGVRPPVVVVDHNKQPPRFVEKSACSSLVANWPEGSYRAGRDRNPGLDFSRSVCPSSH